MQTAAFVERMMISKWQPDLNKPIHCLKTIFKQIKQKRNYAQLASAVILKPMKSHHPIHMILAWIEITSRNMKFQTLECCKALTIMFQVYILTHNRVQNY